MKAHAGERGETRFSEKINEGFANPPSNALLEKIIKRYFKPLCKKHGMRHNKFARYKNCEYD